jgi:hypothetical protein
LGLRLDTRRDPRDGIACERMVCATMENGKRDVQMTRMEIKWRDDRVYP